MIPSSFAYERAETVEQVVALLHASGGEAKVIAGGHSLLPLMKLRLTSPTQLIDIHRIQELRGIAQVGDRVVVGALSTHATLASHPLIREKVPILAEAASKIGDLQVRNRGTVGGNLAHADMASDLPAIALVLDAQFAVVTPEGRQILFVQDFFLGPLTTALPEDGLMTTVSFAIPPVGSVGVYEKFAHPASGYAVVGVAVVVGQDDQGRVNYARVAVTGAGDVAFRSYAVEERLLGEPLTADTAHAVAQHAADDGSMAEDLFASEDYRRHLCTVFTERALRRCMNP